MNHIDSPESIAGGKHAVKGCGGPAALNVSQNYGPGLESGAALQFLSKSIGNSAQPYMAELIFFSAHNTRPVLAGGELCAFGYNHNAEITPPAVTHADFRSNFVDIERLLGNQDHIRAPGYAAVNCNPSRIASHDLNHHHTIVRLRRGMYPVDGFGNDIDCRVEAKCAICARKIVIDGLRNSHHFHSAIKELCRH